MAIKIRIYGSTIEEARARGAELVEGRSPTTGEDATWEITERGHVVELRERNMHDDSDFYAVVWNDAKGAPEIHTYASTRGWTYDNGAAPDMTPEVEAKWAAYQEAEAVRAKIARLLARAARCDVKGLLVRVVRGRKVAKGTVGRVFWAGEASRYAYNSPLRTRIGIDLTGAKDERGRATDVAWTYAENCEPAETDPEVAALVERLRHSLIALEQTYRPAAAAAPETAAATETAA